MPPSVATRLERLPLAELMLVFSTASWGLNLLVGRSLAGSVDPITLNVVRWSGALALLLAIAWRQVWTHRRAILAEWKIIALLGITGMGLFHDLQYTALSLTSAVNVALISSTAPLFIVVMSWLIYRDPVGSRQLLGILVSILGAIVLIARGRLETLLSLDVNAGDLVELAALPFWAAYCTLLRSRPSSVPALALLVAAIVPALIVTLPLMLLVEPVLVPSSASMAGLVYLVVFPSTLAYVTWNGGTRALGPNRAGVFLNLIPVFGALFAVLFLGEPVRPYHGLAALLVLAGILVASTGYRRRLAGAAPRG